LEKVLNYGIYEVFQIGSIYIHNAVSKQTYEFDELDEDIDICAEAVTDWLKEIRKTDPHF